MPKTYKESATPEPDGEEQLGPTALIERHSRGVWRYLRMLGCDCSTADDLTQETFLRVLRRDTFVQHSESATASYLRRTAYNLLVSDHRKHKRVRTVAEASVIDEIWDRWAGKDLAGDQAIEALKVCFSQLTDRAQLALQMRFKEEASRIEIADALGISDHGARNLMQRAKATLKECVEIQAQRIDSK
ncbi:RNA polymerase sigma factor [Rubripirellula amarantea]|uniref:RNA polymerase sigma factor n=1 Tax=Rubripirellula amarantea TaxID=2527999 RepID=UPI001F5F6F30|nr:sigma-70 family RNA polymerase sigma factor [Rubripirellula amarantea]